MRAPHAAVYPWRAAHQPVIVRKRDLGMNLRTALSIYEAGGPSYRGDEEKVRATTIVHAHLRVEEIQALSIAWVGAVPSRGKGAFFAKLEEVRERLRREGSL